MKDGKTGEKTRMPSADDIFSMVLEVLARTIRHADIGS